LTLRTCSDFVHARSRINNSFTVLANAHMSRQLQHLVRAAEGGAMADNPPYDPRSVANLMLRESRRGLTNLALQKLLYLAHGLHLARTGQPLLLGHFEAWKHGPVHPGVYKAFEGWGRDIIRGPASARHPITGAERQIPEPANEDVLDHVREIIGFYGRLSAWQLVDLTHAKGGPWHFTVNNARTPSGLGLRIADTVTLERFARLKMAIKEETRFGEPDEDSPLT
jgi:uncharacterized phage-associated protein